MYALTVMSRELFEVGSLVAWILNAGKIHNAIPVATQNPFTEVYKYVR